MRQGKKVSRVELQEALRLLYANVIASTAISAFVCTAFIFSFHTENQEFSYGKLLWWLVMIVSLALRLFDLASYRKQNTNETFSSEKDLWRFFAYSFLISIIWGIYPILFFPFSGYGELTSTVIIICGISSGVANMWSAHKFTAVSCVLVMSAPYSVLLITSDDDFHHLIGVMGFTYTVVMSLSAIKFSNFTLKAIHLKSENMQLLQNMEKKVESRTKKIYRLSNIDGLTGLLNRTAFLKELSMMVENKTSTPFALLFIDLDGFKQVNDSLGHKAGDKVIKGTVSRITSLQQEPLLICRWGGDEFLIAYPYETIEDINLFTQSLIHEVSLPHTIDQSNAWVGATIGIALYPDHSTQYETLIQNADMAMYQQKRLDKGRACYFNESLRLQIIRERLLSDRIYSAIADNELRLVYQPIIQSSTDKMACMESLLRWNLDGEEISPVEFIPIAEQYGMIKNIGLWVIEEVCNKILELYKNGHFLTVSTNVSMIQLQDDEFVNHIKTLLNRFTFDPSLLHIEITESIFAADKSLLISQIKSLQRMGIKISIDDFGTGYSSLASMQDLGIDYVKIDKSFIKTINSSGSNIVNAVMQISNSLGYKVIAEGVETEEQTEKLKSIGVHYQQGYYFSKPLEATQLNEYIQQHT